MVTLGLWENFVGTDFFLGTTTMHEVGHQLDLWHGGAPPQFSDSTGWDDDHDWNPNPWMRQWDDERHRPGTGRGRVTVEFEPNCKPNHLSVMSYLFQMGGLLDDAGVPHLDYSRETAGDLDERRLLDRPIGTPRYRTAWFAPLGPGTLGEALGTPAAKKFCSGLDFPSSAAEYWVASTLRALQRRSTGMATGKSMERYPVILRRPP